MRRAGLAASAAILAVATLTGCSGASAEDYCNMDTKYSDLDPMKDADEFQDAMDEAVDNAPDDIKSDVETLRDAYQDLDPEDPQAAAEIAEDQEVQDASTAVQDWTKENCE